MERSRPGARTDPHRLVLAIEGGGMRGVVSAGMAAGLESLGLRDVFDAVYGSSAGAINGAYFVSGQARFGTTIYYENINNRRFIDFLRPLRGRPIADLGFLVNQVMTNEKILDWEAVSASPITLAILATQVGGENRDGRPEIFRNPFSDRQELLDALRASATLAGAWIGGDPVRVKARAYIDASVTEGIPLDTASREGASHILVLRTRHPDKHPRIGLGDRLLIAPQLGRYGPPDGGRLKSTFLTRYERYAAAVRHLREAESDRDHFPAALAVNPTVSVRTFETDYRRLVMGAMDGLRQVLKVLGLDEPTVSSQLQATSRLGSPTWVDQRS